MNEINDGAGRVDRRRLLRTGAVAGSLLWATPVVQSVASPAFAAGSPLCATRVEVGNCTITYVPTVDCCECVESHPELSLADALALCARQGVCAEDLVTCGEEEEEPPPDENDRDDRDDQGGVPTVIPAGS